MEAILLGLGVVALVLLWLVLAHKESPRKRDSARHDRHQHQENPEYMPGHGGQAGVGGI